MYHIYDKSLVACIIPSITTAGLFAIGCKFTNELRNLRTQTDCATLNAWAAACYCITLFNSIFTSGAIGIRLWKVYRETVKVGIARKDSVILRALRVLVESAALWTLSVLLNCIAFLANTDLKWTFLDLTSPAMGISFCLIIARLGITAPESGGDGWGSSQHGHVSGELPVFASQPSILPVTLGGVKVERDTSICESESGTMGFHVIDPTPPAERRAPVDGVE